MGPGRQRQRPKGLVTFECLLRAESHHNSIIPLSGPSLDHSPSLECPLSSSRVPAFHFAKHTTQNAVEGTEVDLIPRNKNTVIAFVY